MVFVGQRILVNQLRLVINMIADKGGWRKALRIQSVFLDPGSGDAVVALGLKKKKVNVNCG